MRVYLVKVRGEVNEESVQQMNAGISIIVKGGGDWITTPCQAWIVPKPKGLFSHPFENPEYGPHTWMRISLTEGKFHQVRKMTDAIGHRCVRLIRESIEDIQLGDLQPGKVHEFEEADFFDKLHITQWQDEYKLNTRERRRKEDQNLQN